MIKFGHVNFGFREWSIHRTLDYPGLVFNLGRHSCYMNWIR